MKILTADEVLKRNSNISIKCCMKKSRQMEKVAGKCLKIVPSTKPIEFDVSEEGCKTDTTVDHL